MKHIRKYKLFESQNIEDICKSYGIKNYTVNSDGLIDVDDNVYLNEIGFTKLPIKFNYVNGDFHCYDNQLTTLEGAPNIVDGHFRCNYNQLTSLEYSPKWVEKDFDCIYNKLTSLADCPERVLGDFHCGWNKIEVLVDGPEYIGGGFWCNNNLLREIQYCPKFMGHFNFDGNPIQEVFNLIPLNKRNYDTLSYFVDNDMLRFQNNEWVCVRHRLNDWLKYVGVDEFTGELKNYKMV
jgi:hypothetical protein